MILFHSSFFLIITLKTLTKWYANVFRILGYNTTDFLLHMVYNIEESEEKRLADAFWSSKMGNF